MPTTWHWGERGSIAHAMVHSDLEGGALCGEPIKTCALMRPPLMEVRCSTCELLRWDEPEWFLNKFHDTNNLNCVLYQGENAILIPSEMDYLRLEFCIQRMLDRDGFVPFLQVIRSESQRWPEVLFDPMDLPVMPTTSLAVDFGSILVWEFLDRFPALCDVLD